MVFNSMVFAQGVSLGDAARQERERQKNSTGNIKVTNETLGTAVAPPPSTEPVKPEAEAAKAADGKAEAKTDVKPDATAEGPHRRSQLA